MKPISSGSLEPLQPRHLTPAREVVLAEEASGTPPLLPRSETFQVLDVGSRRIVLSALDDPVSIGKGGDHGGDFEADKGVVVFAEGVSIAGDFQSPSIEVCTHSIDQVIGSKPALDVSGKDGTSWALQTAVDANGADGGDGDPGGSIHLFIESLPDSIGELRLIAKGGDGGEGQSSANGMGGAGGSGREGGDVEVYFSNRDLAQLSAIRACIAEEDDVARARDARQILADLTSDPDRYASLSGEIDALAALLHGSTVDPDRLRDVLVPIGYGLEAAVDRARTHLITRTNVRGGDYGVHGSGFTGEKRNGTSGRPGKLLVEAVRLDDPAARPSNFIFVHPDQCRMLLDKAKIAYFVGGDELIASAAILLRRLIDRTAFAVELAADSPVRKLYEEHGDDYAVSSGIDRLARLNDQATQLFSQLRLGSDYYGHAATYAPLVSESYYQDLLDRQLGHLEVVESAYKAYYAAFEAQQTTLDQVRQARAQARAAIDDAQAQLTILGQLTAQTARAIAVYAPQLATKKQALLDAMKGLEDQINKKFDVSFDNILSALTTVAFAPNKFMVGVQLAGVLYKGAEEIPNDQGVDVNKKYLISGIRSSEATISSLTEGFAAQKDGTLASDDPGAAKLVVARDQFEKLMEDMTGKLSDLKDVEKAFDDYIGAIVERNNQILRYNAILNTEWDKLALIRTYEAELEQFSDETLKTLRPDLPAVAGFVARLYHDARDRVLETLYSTSRAYRFWALSNRDPVQQTFASVAPPDIDTAMLRAVQVTLLGDLADALQALQRAPQSFPPEDSSGPGIVLALDPEQVDTLRTEGLLLFQIEPVRPDTTKDESPFAGWANIRLRRVRAWLDGATTSDGEIMVDITHLGGEQVVDTSGTTFTFSHDPIDIGFKYRLDGTLPPLEDGDIASRDDNRFAPVGPFAWWQIAVNPAYNKDLDLSGLTGVRLEFFGSNYIF